MKISVVTIVYNDVVNIEHTLKNVIGQTAIDKIEYIVVDGASDDGTSETSPDSPDIFANPIPAYIMP